MGNRDDGGLDSLTLLFRRDYKYVDHLHHQRVLMMQRIHMVEDLILVASLACNQFAFYSRVARGSS